MKKIILETMQSLINYLPKMVDASNEMATQFQMGNEGKALSRMPNYVEGLQWIVDAISGIQKNGQLNEINLFSLKECFGEVTNCLEIKDYVLLSDLLEYEIAPKLEGWNSIILRYADELEDNTNS